MQNTGNHMSLKPNRHLNTALLCLLNPSSTYWKPTQKACNATNQSLLSVTKSISCGLTILVLFLIFQKMTLMM